MFGSHLSIAGGVHNALIEAQSYGMTALQVFTANQRQWNPKPLTPNAVKLWREHRDQVGVKEVVSHDSYLINMASPDSATRDKSIRLYHQEMLRCEALGIRWLVMHPGSHLKAGEEAGIERIIKAFDQLHDELPDPGVVTCLEITAGQGTNLGYRFEHLASIMNGVRDAQRMAVCLDTAHLLAAGYDLTSARGAQSVIHQADETIGLDRVKVLHMNDSKTPRGSRVDRHEHIGHGHIAMEAFEVIVNEPAFKGVPKILETAKDKAPDGRPWDAVNLETLRGLVKQKK